MRVLRQHRPREGRLCGHGRQPGAVQVAGQAVQQRPVLLHLEAHRPAQGQVVADLTAQPGHDTAPGHGATLYLSDEELSLNTATGTVTGTRYYAIGGQTIAAGTGSGLVYLAGDQQDTEAVAISASTLAVTDRYYDPYGNPIGTPATGFPDGEKGFTGGVTDTATGLTNLGAREYQPQTGSFISTDSVLQPYDPQDLNAYTYAADNPATYSDPTGASATNKCPAGVTCTANAT
jgi:RHS repeat-associated protein